MVELLNGRYVLGEMVGSGGMGAVHRATDIRLSRTVAIKILRDGPLADDAAQARMRSEANLAASINHPGTAQVFDFIAHDPSNEGPTFIVMQFVEGHTLAQLLHEQGPMPVDQVMSVVVQVAEGLQAAHDAGIVHRDLKPANIMLTPAGRTVLVDFGIARSATSEPLTNTGTLIGTADYMSPEQAVGRTATPQSDLYSLGVVAYHCLTGRSPFRRDSPIATALAHLNEDLPPLGPRVRSDVSDLIMHLTSRTPSERPTSAAAVALQAAAIGATGVIDLPTTFEGPAPTMVTPISQSPAETTAAPEEFTTSFAPVTRRKRPKAVYAGIGAVVLALSFFGLQTMQRSDPPVVPGVVGMNVDDATARIRDAGMAVSPRTVDLAGKPAGQVVDQTPRGGQPGSSAEPVRISVASGKVAVMANEVIGDTYADASATLEKLGLEVNRNDVTRSAKVGSVVALDKSGRLLTGTTVTLSVAVAPVAAPSTAGQSAGSAGSTGSGSGSGTGNGKGNKASGKPKAKSNK